MIVWLSMQRRVPLVSSKWLNNELVKDHHDKNSPTRTEFNGLHWCLLPYQLAPTVVFYKYFNLFNYSSVDQQYL